MENSKIEWTDHTFNPWEGCTKVSEGCKHCYAEALRDHRFKKVQWGPQGERLRTSAENWGKPAKWNKQAQKAGIRYRVFCASLADVFENNPQLLDWRQELFAMIEQTPSLDWLLLTKRPQHVFDFVPKHWLAGLPVNVWLGTSVENQEQADKRIPHLLAIPAKVRFLSMEPLLGAVDLRRFEYPYQEDAPGLNSGHDWLTGETWQHSSIFGGGNSWLTNDEREDYGEKRIHWVIVGGESGAKARLMHPNWVRKIRDDCQKTGVPFLYKQWGEWVPDDHPAHGTRWRYVGDDKFAMKRVGKHAAGRLLDGREWNEFPL